MIDLLMQIGTALAALVTLPQIYAVYKNREVLKGYSPIPCLGLCLAMISFGWAFYLMNNWFSVLCEIPVAFFWGLASYYSWRYNV